MPLFGNRSTIWRGRGRKKPSASSARKNGLNENEKDDLRTKQDFPKSTCPETDRPPRLRQLVGLIDLSYLIYRKFLGLKQSLLNFLSKFRGRSR